MELKSNINVCIAKRGLSKKEVANQMDVSRTVLSRWIHGHSKPSLENAFKLARILDCKVDDLFIYK